MCWMALLMVFSLGTVAWADSPYWKLLGEPRQWDNGQDTEKEYHDTTICVEESKNPKVAQNAGKILSNVMHCWIMLPFSQITFMSIPD